MGEVCPSKGCPTETCPSEVCLGKNCPTEVGITEVDVAEVWPHVGIAILPLILFLHALSEYFEMFGIGHCLRFLRMTVRSIAERSIQMTIF